MGRWVVLKLLRHVNDPLDASSILTTGFALLILTPIAPAGGAWLLTGLIAAHSALITLMLATDLGLHRVSPR